jgi:hypothetical protein
VAEPEIVGVDEQEAGVVGIAEEPVRVAGRQADWSFT